MQTMRSNWMPGRQGFQCEVDAALALLDIDVHTHEGLRELNTKYNYWKEQMKPTMDNSAALSDQQKMRLRENFAVVEDKYHYLGKNSHLWLLPNQPAQPSR